MTKFTLVGMTPDEMAAALQICGLNPDYAPRIAYWVYKKRVPSTDMMTSIAAPARHAIGYCFQTGFVAPVSRICSADGTVRYVFDYDNGLAVESVFIPETRRNTVCVSAQCGCARACAYCRTGEMGLRADLTAARIVNQVMAIPESASVTHIVFMGMGEPLDNPDEVIKAINIMTAEWGLAIAHVNITVSTVGILPAITAFLESTRCNLAFSLFSPISEERAEFVPVEKIYPASEIINLLRKNPPSKKRRFTLAYMMLEGINDTDMHLEELIRLTSGTSIRINLLNYHPHGKRDFRPSSPARQEYFRQRLAEAGVSVSLRKSRGEDINAACGLLALRSMNYKPNYK